MKISLLLLAAIAVLASAFQPRPIAEAASLSSRQLRNDNSVPRASGNDDSERIDSVNVSSIAPSFFLPEFDVQAAVLSTDRIVEMIPERRSDTTSSSVAEVVPASPLRQELFNSPLISVLYERLLPPLWEAGLRLGGPDAEYEAAADFLDGPTGGSILDLSCGTGFVALRFASEGTYGQVFALDYSDKMLGELVVSVRRRRGDEDGNGKEGLPLSIIRGDAGALPFRSESLDAVHWGAAMHCVPSAENALEEVHRVLKPGGKLYATTFLRPFPDVVFRFFTVEEMVSLATGAGFEAENVEAVGRGVYGILRATK